MKTPDGRQHKMREKLKCPAFHHFSILDKICLWYFISKLDFCSQFAKMRCQSANLDFKFIFHQLMSADCNIVRQFITQQWGGQLFSRPKLHKSTPSFLRFRDIFYFLLPTVSDSSAPRCDSDPLSAAQEAATPTTHWVTVWGLSYQTYQIFNNKHLNRSSLSALRTNDPPWWLCS